MNVLVIGPVFPDESEQSVESPLLSAGGSQAHHKAEAVSMFAMPSLPTKEWCVCGGGGMYLMEGVISTALNYGL